MFGSPLLGGGGDVSSSGGLGWKGVLTDIGLTVAGAAGAAAVAKLNKYSTPQAQQQIQQAAYGVPPIDPYKPWLITGGILLAGFAAYKLLMKG